MNSGRRRLRAALPALPALLLAAGLYFGFTGWVASTELPPLVPETSVEVLARDGRLLRAFTVADGRWRLAVTAEDVDPDYLAMLIAYEDARFERHNGVDPLALARAVVQGVMNGRLVSGGSTLTMQVARLLEDGSTGSWRGKLRQLRVALALERQLSKREILDLYLNLAPMGGNVEGVRAGSLTWFGKEPALLTDAQAALLIALPQAPAAREPDEHPENARLARDRVLERAAGAGVITPEAARAGFTESVPAVRRAFPQLAPHLADRLRAANPAQAIHLTTIDAELQATLERLAQRSLLGLPREANLAVLVADSASGEIVASVGSADYTSDLRHGYVDLTQALRSPGSTLKPLVYGLAFSAGIAHPETLLNDRPEDFGGYAPQNFDGYFRGPVTAREALQTSLNLPAVSLTAALGPARLLAALRESGVEAVVPGDEAGLAVALGGVGVSLEGLVQLYAALARGGEVRPLTVTVGDAGPESLALDAQAPGQARPFEQSTSPRPRLLTPEAAWQVADVLAGAPRPADLPKWELAVKTGTSHAHRDALALGFDGEHVVGVWVGRADGTPVPGMTGAENAEPLLFEVFARLGGPVALPPPPPNALLVAATSELPEPLQRLGVRPSVADDAPRLVFPPEGAALMPLASGVPARVERGQAPFTWFANGVPVEQQSYEHEVRLPLQGPGFVTLSVVDAEGRASRVSVELQ